VRIQRIAIIGNQDDDTARAVAKTIRELGYEPDQLDQDAEDQAAINEWLSVNGAGLACAIVVQPPRFREPRHGSLLPPPYEEPRCW